MNSKIKFKKIKWIAWFKKGWFEVILSLKSSKNFRGYMCLLKYFEFLLLNHKLKWHLLPKFFQISYKNCNRLDSHFIHTQNTLKPWRILDFSSLHFLKRLSNWNEFGIVWIHCKKMVKIYMWTMCQMEMKVTL